MAANQPSTRSEEHFAYALLSTSFLLGCRGPELELCLAGCTRPEVRKRLHGALVALQHGDRSRRLKALRPGVALLRSELQKHNWTP